MVSVDVLIQPVVLRFSLSGDEVVYHFAGGAEAQLDQMELLLGIDPTTQRLFDSNLGFLPVCTTVLIRGEKNIVVDPGNTHVGFYGLLDRALEQKGLAASDIDVVVATHSHHDHMANIVRFPGAELVVGADELDFAREGVGALHVDAMISELGSINEVARGEAIELCEGVRVVSAPGHTPGHVVVVAESGEDRYLMTGDGAMTKAEFVTRELGHWYDDEQRAEMARSLEIMHALEPTVVLPGHDRAFRTCGTAL